MLQVGRKLVELNYMEGTYEVRRRRCAKKRVNFFLCLSGISIVVNLLNSPLLAKRRIAGFVIPLLLFLGTRLCRALCLTTSFPLLLNRYFLGKFSNGLRNDGVLWLEAVVCPLDVVEYGLSVSTEDIIYIASLGFFLRWVTCAKQVRKQRVEWKCLCQS